MLPLLDRCVAVKFTSVPKGDEVVGRREDRAVGAVLIGPEA